jgi:hypothetical protein
MARVGWHLIDEALEGSVIQEFAGTGLTDEEMLAAYEKVQGDREVNQTFKAQNEKLIKAGKPALQDAPSTGYLKSRLVRLVNPKSVPEGHPLKSHFKASPAVKTSAPAVAMIEKPARGDVTSLKSRSRSCPSVKMTQSQGAIENTVGKAGNVFGMVGTLVQAFFPGMNPLHGSPIGVPCADAKRILNRTVCQWDGPLNPLNKIMQCSTITSVTPQNRKAFVDITMGEAELCTATYDSTAFNVESGATKEYLKRFGYLEANGAPPSRGGVESLVKELRSRFKISDEVIKTNRQVPESEVIEDQWSRYQRTYPDASRALAMEDVTTLAE